MCRLLTLFVCAPVAHAATRPRPRLDAQVLSRYGVVFPEPDTHEQEGDEEREELRQLLSRRRQLVEQRVQDRSRLDKGLSASVGKSTRRHISWLDKEMSGWIRSTELLKRDNLCRQADLYRSVPGVGQLTAATLPICPNWAREGKALTSGGARSVVRDSGKKRGNRSIRGGRSTVRAVLYMAAMSVIRVEGSNAFIKVFGNGARR